MYWVILTRSLQTKFEIMLQTIKNEFLAIEDILSIDVGKLRYDMFVRAYNETREHGGINGGPRTNIISNLFISLVRLQTKLI